MMNLHLPNADVRMMPEFMAKDLADRLFAALLKNLPWEQRDVVVGGKTFPQPRLTAWFGDSSDSYTYSGLTLNPHAWTKELAWLRNEVEKATGIRFNSALANLYRTNRDSIGMHSDSEPELGYDPIIVSVSLGRTRSFILAPKKGKPGKRVEIPLTHGSLLYMGKGTQPNWMHGIDKEAAYSNEPRINLTFRNIQQVKGTKTPAHAAEPEIKPEAPGRFSFLD
jgi:alkylated DNA repair dioxygenase AlkB